MYAAVCGLRHLLHGLTVFGVAAAHLADLQAREAHLFDEYLKLQAALESAKNAMAAARTTLRELRARLHALPPAKPGEAKLIDEIADAEGVINDASADVTDRRSAVARNSVQLQLVQSKIAAMQGALLACVPPCHVVPTPSRLLRPPLAIILLPPLRARPAQGMACCVHARSSRLCCVALLVTPTDSQCILFNNSPAATGTLWWCFSTAGCSPCPHCLL